MPLDYQGIPVDLATDSDICGRLLRPGLLVTVGAATWEDAGDDDRARAVTREPDAPVTDAQPPLLDAGELDNVTDRRITAQTIQGSDQPLRDLAIQPLDVAPRAVAKTQPGLGLLKRTRA
jgi:hypothetical protein